MSINVKSFQIHQLSKSDDGELMISFGSHELPIASACDDLVNDLHFTFRGKPKAFGVFKSDSEFKSVYDSYVDGSTSWYDMTKTYGEGIVRELSKYPFADTGVLVITQYRCLATDYLMICVVPSKHGLSVLPGAHQINQTDYLDIPQMTIAAQFNLSSYFAKNSDDYYHLSFIKGRAGRRVSDFFLDFLCADVAFDAKQQNTVLLQAVSDFISDSKLEKSESLQLKKQVSDYCKDKKNNGDNIVVSDLSAELPVYESGQSFNQYITSNGYDLESEFPTEDSVIKKLTKYVGAGGGLNISFDAMIFGERVFYDPETDTLTIKGTPPNLRDQLTRDSK